jgi:hypothetical protein
VNQCRQSQPPETGSDSLESPKTHINVSVRFSFQGPSGKCFFRQGARNLGEVSVRVNRFPSFFLRCYSLELEFRSTAVNHPQASHRREKPRKMRLRRATAQKPTA